MQEYERQLRELLYQILREMGKEHVDHEVKFELSRRLWTWRPQ